MIDGSISKVASYLFVLHALWGPYPRQDQDAFLALWNVEYHETFKQLHCFEKPEKKSRKPNLKNSRQGIT